MSENNVMNDDLTSNRNFDNKGKFAKGNNIAHGRRTPSAKKDLIVALKKAGKKQQPPVKFWDAVADKFYLDKDIMKAVIMKLLPNTNEISGTDGGPINIFLRERDKGEELDES